VKIRFRRAIHLPSVGLIYRRPERSPRVPTSCRGSVTITYSGKGRRPVKVGAIGKNRSETSIAATIQIGAVVAPVYSDSRFAPHCLKRLLRTQPRKAWPSRLWPSPAIGSCRLCSARIFRRNKRTGVFAGRYGPTGGSRRAESRKGAYGYVARRADVALGC